MKCTMLSPVLLMFGHPLAPSPGPQQAKSPGQEQTIIITDYEAPPLSLEAAWQMVQLIVQGTIRRSTPVENESRPGVRIPTTQHIVEVVEVLKGDRIAPGATIIGSQSVGETSDGLVKHDGGGRPFSPGEEYVLFLESSRAGGFGPAWGHGGAYPVTGDTVTIPMLRGACGTTGTQYRPLKCWMSFVSYVPGPGSSPIGKADRVRGATTIHPA